MSLGVHEENRLAGLYALKILDTPAEARLDRITRMASVALAVPITLISLVDRNRQWFKSCVGLAATETPRSMAFCSHTVEQGELLVIPDASMDARFADNPLVVEAPYIRFYAGHPIRDPEGYAVGTLCVIDEVPRHLTAAQLQLLQDFALLAQEELSKGWLATDAKAVRQALHNSEKQYEATFEHAAAGIAHVGMDGRWLQVNPALCNILGYSVDQLLTLTFQDVTFGEDAAEDTRLIEQLLRGDIRSFSVERRYIRKDRTTIWTSVTVSLHRDVTEKPTFFIAIVEDIQHKKDAQTALETINAKLEARVAERTQSLTNSNDALALEVTQRKEIEAQLRASEDRFRTIIESSYDAFIAIDSGGVITEWNKAAERMFGWSSIEAIGRELTTTVVPVKYQDRHREGIKRYLETKNTTISNKRIEMPARTKSGAEIPVEMTITPYQINGTYLFGAFLHDVSERKATARELAEKQQLLDAVLETVDVAVVACSADGELTLFNRAAREYHGMSVESVRADNWAEHYDLFESDGRSHLRTEDIPLMRALRGEIVKNAQLTIVPKKLKPRTLLASGQALITAEGVKMGAVVAMKDVTDLKETERRLIKNEQRLRAITENLPSMIGHIDRYGTFRFLNEKAAKFYGFRSEDLLGKHVSTAHTEQAYNTVKHYIERALTGERVSFEDEHEFHGKRFHFHATYIPDFDAAGNPDGFFAMAFDITSRKFSELRQKESEERLRTITDNLPVFIAYVDDALIYRFANATYERWLDAVPASMIGKSVQQLLGTDAFEARKRHFIRCLAGETVHFEASAIIKGEERTLESVYIPDIKNTIVKGIYILSSDITKVKVQERELLQLARTDALTGLPNRRAYEEKVQEAVLRAMRTGKPMALMFLDVDYFKKINDTLGHAGGDEVLIEFARRLRSAVRATDTVSRLAGDEFTIILEGVGSHQEAAQVAEKILKTVSSPFLIAGEHYDLSTSIGVAYTASPQISVPQLSKTADDALYKVKAAGRNGYQLECELS